MAIIADFALKSIKSPNNFAINFQPNRLFS